LLGQWQDWGLIPDSAMCHLGKVCYRINILGGHRGFTSPVLSLTSSLQWQ